MNALLGNGIALLLTAGLVFLSARELWRGHKKGGCGRGCAGCNGNCAGCAGAEPGKKRK